MKEIFLKLPTLMLMGVIVLFSACSSNTNEENFIPDSASQDEKVIGLEQFQQTTSPIIEKLAEKSFNYNTTSTRSMQADNDTLRELSACLSVETKKLLEQNDIDVSEILNEEDGDYRMAYLGLLILDYEKVTNAEDLTRASIDDCVLKAAGLGELVGKAVSKKVVMRALIKCALKRAIPYIGWGMAIADGAACLAGY